MISSILFSGRPRIKRPKTIYSLGNSPYLNEIDFFKLVDDLKNRPRSDIMFERLYNECNSIIYHHGKRSFTGLDSSIKIKLEDGEGFNLYKRRASLNTSATITLDFGDSKDKEWWNLYTYYSRLYQKNMPRKFERFDKNIKLLSISTYY